MATATSTAARPFRDTGMAGPPKMQSWYIDKSGKHVRTSEPVPVNAESRRTSHVLYTCGTVTKNDRGGYDRCPEQHWLLPGATRHCPDHGGKLTAPITGERQRLMVREASRMHGAAALPWVVLTVTAAAGVIARVGDAAPTGVLTVGVGAAGVAYVAARRVLTARAIKARRMEKGQKSGRQWVQIARTARTTAGVVTVAGMWVTAAAVVDLSTTVGKVVWVGLPVAWAVGAVPWWRRVERQRRRVPAVVVTPTRDEPVRPAEDPIRARAVTTWQSLIGAPSGPLSGTELAEFARLPSCLAGGDRKRLPNWTATVRATAAGSINMREQRPSLIGRIAAAYGCSYGDVSFHADETDLSVGYVRVQPDNVLAEVRMWLGPDVSNDWMTGTSTVGRFDDGQPIVYAWWTDTGSVHDLISGCTGSGKSELVAQLILDSLHSYGLVLDWVGDPQGGQSYGALKDQVDWFARDKTEITYMLLAAKKEMLRRNDVLAQANAKTWRADPEMPLLVITLDEVQSYIEDPVILQLVEDLVSQARKCGIKMRLITQVPAVYNLGGSSQIKEQLRAGQAFTFRAATDIAGRLAVDSESPFDPTMLPAKWGGATCGAGKTTAGLLFVVGVHGRDVYGRADFTGGDMSVWLEGELSPGVFGESAAAGSGGLWGRRHERIAAALAAGRSDSDLLAGGKAVELIAAASGQSLELFPPDLGGRGRAVDVVLAAAQVEASSDGVVSKQQIVTATPTVSTSARDKALGDLVESGALRRIRNGVYAV